MTMSYVLAATHKWYADIPNTVRQHLGVEIIWIAEKSYLTRANLDNIKPRYVFFPHWSFVVPPEIYENFECVIFHMTDVPFGRGGTPLQNLIVHGLSETKISALRCTSEIDGGPVYFKRALSLQGNAEEIYIRASRVIADMIGEIIRKEPTPVPQVGEVVRFHRRKPEESNISHLAALEEAFDYIRMLDAEGYPRAFLESEHLRFEFSRASLKSDSVLADVKITRKK